MEASGEDEGRPMDASSGLPGPPDDGRVRSGSPAPWPAAPRPPPAAALVSAPTVSLPVPPVLSPLAPVPLVRDSESRAKPLDMRVAAAASSRPSGPDARIKVELTDCSRTGRIDRDRLPPVSRYESLRRSG